MKAPSLKTNRLSLRPWQTHDLTPFAAMNADPLVMEYFPATQSQEESKYSMERIIQHFDEYGFGLWTATLIGSDEWIGFIGLQHVNFSAPFTPAIEIGWRLGLNYWGKGYATEGANAALQYGFIQLQLPEIVSFTATQNIRSQRVMKKIGMHHNLKEDFDHPRLPEGHPLRKHVLYRLKQNEWEKSPGNN